MLHLVGCVQRVSDCFCDLPINISPLGMWANREYGLVFLTRGKGRVLDVTILIRGDLTASSDNGGPYEAIAIAAESADKWESRLIYRSSRHCLLNS